MAQATRGLLFTAFGLVLAVAMAAGINAGEYTLTLALGAMTATLIGIGFMMQAGSSRPSKTGGIGVQTSATGVSQNIEAETSLPDPMAQDFEMPL